MLEDVGRDLQVVSSYKLAGCFAATVVVHRDQAEQFVVFEIVAGSVAAVAVESGDEQRQNYREYLML